MATHKPCTDKRGKAKCSSRRRPVLATMACPQQDFTFHVLGTWRSGCVTLTLLVNGRYKVARHACRHRSNLPVTGISLPKVLRKIVHRTQVSSTLTNIRQYQDRAVPVHPCMGSTSTGGCDGLWQNCDITAVALRFGSCVLTNAGLRSLLVDNAATTASWNIGAAILLLPPVGVAA